MSAVHRTVASNPNAPGGRAQAYLAVLGSFAIVIVVTAAAYWSCRGVPPAGPCPPRPAPGLAGLPTPAVEKSGLQASQGRKPSAADQGAAVGRRAGVASPGLMRTLQDLAAVHFVDAHQG